MEKLRTRSTVSPVAIVKYLKNMIPKENTTYGYFTEYPCAISAPPTPFRLRVSKFTVPDSSHGIEVVAVALGYSMPNPSRYDDCADFYQTIGRYEAVNDCSIFEQPILMLSKQDLGCRVIWGGPQEAFLCSCDIGAEKGWTTDIYKLRPGLPDGGIIVQSSNSAAALTAEKQGDEWTLCFLGPVYRSHEFGQFYESTFRGAFNWYKCQLQSA